MWNNVLQNCGRRMLNKWKFKRTVSKETAQHDHLDIVYFKVISIGGWYLLVNIYSIFFLSFFFLTRFCSFFQLRSQKRDFSQKSAKRSNYYNRGEGGGTCTDTATFPIFLDTWIHLPIYLYSLVVFHSIVNNPMQFSHFVSWTNKTIRSR